MASTYLQRSISSAGSETKGTFSAWVKRTGLSSYQKLYTSRQADNEYFTIQFTNTDAIGITLEISGSHYLNLITAALFRDTSAWYHIVVVVDSTDSTQADRCKVYVNGSRITSFSTNTNNMSQNINARINGTAQTPRIGTFSGSGDYFDGVMSHIHWIDGTAYQASTFGSTDATTGEWKINTSPSVTYGTNGFFVLKDGNSVTDQSGNSNNLTVGGGTLTNTEDNPSNVFCTFNDLLPQSNTGLSKGNTRFETTSGSGWKSMCGTLGMVKNSGKYYMEFKHLGGSYNGYGIADLKNGGIVDQINQSQTTYPGEAANSYGYLSQGELHYNASQTGTGWDSYTTNDIIGMAVDMENMKLYYHKNGSYLQSGNPSTGTNGYSINDPVGAYFPTATVNAGIMCANFGNGSFDGTAISSEGSNASGHGKFEYDVPTGYTALCTKGLNE